MPLTGLVRAQSDGLRTLRRRTAGCRKPLIRELAEQRPSTKAWPLTVSEDVVGPRGIAMGEAPVLIHRDGIGSRLEIEKPAVPKSLQHAPKILRRHVPATHATATNVDGGGLDVRSAGRIGINVTECHRNVVVDQILRPATRLGREHIQNHRLDDVIGHDPQLRERILNFTQVPFVPRLLTGA